MVSLFPFQPHSCRSESSRAELAAGKEVSWYLAVHTCAYNFFSLFFQMCRTELVIGAESLLIFSNSDS